MLVVYLEFFKVKNFKLEIKNNSPYFQSDSTHSLLIYA